MGCCEYSRGGASNDIIWDSPDELVVRSIGWLSPTCPCPCASVKVAVTLSTGT